MASFTPKPAQVTRPPVQVDWERVFAGEPFSLRGFSAEELAAARRPLPRPSRVDPAQSTATPDGRPRYPAGPWVRCADATGGEWWWHVAALERARLWQFQRAGGAA